MVNEYKHEFTFLMFLVAVLSIFATPLMSNDNAIIGALIGAIVFILIVALIALHGLERLGQ